MEKEERILKAIEAYNDALKDPESSWRHRLGSQNGCRIKRRSRLSRLQLSQQKQPWIEIYSSIGEIPILFVGEGGGAALPILRHY